MRRVIITTTMAYLTLCLVSPHAEAVQCSQVTNGQINNLKTLFKYSQLAESPSDRREGETTNCSDGTTEFVPSMGTRQGVSVPTEIAQNIRNGLIQQEYGAIFRTLTTDGQALYLGCPAGSESNVLVGLILRVFGWERNLVIEMNAFAETRRNGRITGEPIRPEVDSLGVLRIPGTSLGNPGQVLTNFANDGCIFPATQYVVDAICQAHNAGSLVLIEQDGATNGDEAGSRRREAYRALELDPTPTLVGHSLGGAAAQYIAQSQPGTPMKDGWQRCPNVNAYTFGSTGLTSRSNGENPTPRGHLKTHVSDCDWVTALIGSDRVQTGNITALSSNSHKIDDLQSELCKCIVGRPNEEGRQFEIMIGVGSRTNDGPTNSEICETAWEHER